MSGRLYVLFGRLLGRQSLAHLVQEQMTDLGKIQMPMDRLPAPNLEMIEAQFVLLLAETLFNRPSRVRYVHQPFQRGPRCGVRHEELDLLAPLGIASYNQPVRPGRQPLAPHEELDRLHLANNRPLLAVLDVDRRPRLARK